MDILRTSVSPFSVIRLADFFYACGRLTHVEKNCFAADVVGEVLQFGEWLPYKSVTPRPLLSNSATTHQTGLLTEGSDGKSSSLDLPSIDLPAPPVLPEDRA